MSDSSIRSRAATLALMFLVLFALILVPWGLRRQDLTETQKSRFASGPVLSLGAESKPLARIDQESIRVAVTGLQKQLDLSIDGPYQFRPVGSSKVLSRGDKLAATTVTATGSGLKIGKIEYAITRLEIVPSQSPSVWINGHEYRGTVRFFRQQGGSIRAINVLPIAEYLASVVDSEMPTSFGVEARKAQAIVARTYALDVLRSGEGNAEFDLFASTSSQKYLGFQYRDGSRRLAGESEASRQIVRDTTGIVAMFQGRLFRTYYSAVCGGQTTRGTAVFSDAVSALKSVSCEYCREAKLYRWESELPKAVVSDKLKEHFRGEGKSFDRLLSMKLASGQSNSGLEVPEFEVRDGKRSHRISAATLRRLLPPGKVYSPFFTVTENSDKLQFSGRGHGHAAGLCQWGARGQGLAGKTAYEIVRYYYTGAKLVQLQ
ncbi:MAG: SpoIID/LytB domain-containing protein [Planctomycetia bacterium]|nr:SpoIID/LytB domain-containing protein [Planctomycetia bacterium]